VPKWYLFMQRLSNAVQLVLVHAPSGVWCPCNHPQKTLFSSPCPLKKWWWVSTFIISHLQSCMWIFWWIKFSLSSAIQKSNFCYIKRERKPSGSPLTDNQTSWILSLFFNLISYVSSLSATLIFIYYQSKTLSTNWFPLSVSYSLCS